MNRTALLSLMAIMMGTSVAMADGRDGDRKEDLTFKCHFSAEGKGGTECKAWIKIEKEGRGGGTLNDRDRDDDFRARMVVSCDGYEVFEGRADADFRHDTITVEPKHGELPRIQISDDRDNHKFDATLEFEKGTIDGYCKYKNKRGGDLF